LWFSTQNRQHQSFIATSPCWCDQTSMSPDAATRSRQIRSNWSISCGASLRGRWQNRVSARQGPVLRLGKPTVPLTCSVVPQCHIRTSH
jgi:hypothetical protein